MKLLIVDDEELTRTGVISSINWESLGITEIFQAERQESWRETRQHRSVSLSWLWKKELERGVNNG